MFDYFFSIAGIILLVPLFVLIALLVKLSSAGPVIFKQQRVGKGGKIFVLYKFRTMYTNAPKKGFLTIGDKDNRITKPGYLLRKFKLDELPQLFNVLVGDMSLVGPRPEVQRYVSLYTQEQRKVLQVRPGITDMASIIYRDENERLASVPNPEEYYVKHILPEKIELNFLYIRNQSAREYFRIIFKTLLTAIKGR